MLPLFDMLANAQNGNAIDQMARQFGLSQQQAQEAMAALMPAFSQGLKRNTANPYDLGSFLSAALFFDQPLLTGGWFAGRWRPVFGTKLPVRRLGSAIHLYFAQFFPIPGRRWPVRVLDHGRPEVKPVVPVSPPFVWTAVRMPPVHLPNAERSRAPLLDENQRRTGDVNHAGKINHGRDPLRLFDQNAAIPGREYFPVKIVLSKLGDGDKVVIGGRDVRLRSRSRTRRQRCPADIPVTLPP